MSKAYNAAYLSVESLVEDMKIDAYGFGAIQNWTILERLLTSASHKACRVLLADFPCLRKLTIDTISRKHFADSPDIWLVATKILARLLNGGGSGAFLTARERSHLVSELTMIITVIMQLLDDSSTALHLRMFEFSESLLLCLFCIAKLSSQDAGTSDNVTLLSQLKQALRVGESGVWNLQRDLLVKLCHTICSAPIETSGQQQTSTQTDAAFSDSINGEYCVRVLPTSDRAKLVYLWYIHTVLYKLFCTTLVTTLTSSLPHATKLSSVVYYYHDCIQSLHAYQHDPSVLQIAITNVDYTTVDSILTAYPSLVHYTNSEGHMWLHMCCIQDYQYYTEYHTAHSGKSNSVNSNLSRSNSSAESFKTSDSAAISIITGAELTTPLHASEQTLPACTSPHNISLPIFAPYTVQLLTPLQYSMHSELTLQTLLKHNTNTNTADLTGRTALHTCTNVRTISLLCNAGADPNQADSTGITPLHQYVLSNQVECVRVLLEYGADPAIAECMKGRTSVHYAAMLGMYDVLYTLLRYSTHIIDLECRDSSGNTALHLCAACQTTDPTKCILLLLNQGAAVKATTSTGITALHLLCCNALLNTPQNTTSEPLVEMLLQRGANPNARDSDNCTPLIVACAYREFALCKLLLLYGGDLNIPCSMHSTFLSVGFVDHFVDIHSNSGSDKCSPKDNINNSSHTDYEDTESIRSNNTNTNTPTKYNASYNISSAFDYTSYYTTNTNTSGNNALETITATDLLPKKPRYSVFSSINSLQSRIPCANRDRCMNCGDALNGSDGTVYGNVNSVYSATGDGSGGNLVNKSMYDSGVSTVNSSISSMYANISSIGTIVNNKIRSGRHHCRLCRRVVCIQCSNRKLTGAVVPLFVREQYTHEKEHRMCDICYDVLCDRGSEGSSGGGGGTSVGSGGSGGSTDDSGSSVDKSGKGGVTTFKSFGFMSFYK